MSFVTTPLRGNRFTFTLQDLIPFDTFRFLPSLPPPSPQDSRFQENFDQIKLLNKGAFGRVYEAEKKMENKKYAVKCIRLGENNEEMVQASTREVKVLSAIKHRNIVFYYSSWWEKHPPPDWQDDHPDEKNDDSSSENDEISFDSRRLEEEERRYENSSVTSSLDQLTPSSKRKSSDSNSDVSFRAGTNDRRWRQDRRSVDYTYLYIQMELCRQENLGNWLKNRQPNELKVYQMYRAILSAVNYLHSEGLVHRDLKPRHKQHFLRYRLVD